MLVWEIISNGRFFMPQRRLINFAFRTENENDQGSNQTNETYR